MIWLGLLTAGALIGITAFATRKSSRVDSSDGNAEQQVFRAIESWHEIQNQLMLLDVQTRRLSGISDSSEGTSNDELKSRLSEAARMIDQATRKIEAQVREIRSVVCGSSRKRFADVRSAISHVVQEHRALCDEKGIKINYVAPEFPVLFRCHKARLQVAVSNLILNSVQAVGERGWITIELDDPNDRIMIKVSDSHGGFSESEFREAMLPGVSHRAGGFGFGLPTVARVTKEHAGTLYLGDQVNKTTVVLDLPRRSLPFAN